MQVYRTLTSSNYGTIANSFRLNKTEFRLLNRIKGITFVEFTME